MPAGTHNLKETKTQPKQEKWKSSPQTFWRSYQQRRGWKHDPAPGLGPDLTEFWTGRKPDGRLQKYRCGRSLHNANCSQKGSRRQNDQLQHACIMTFFREIMDGAGSESFTFCSFPQDSQFSCILWLCNRSSFLNRYSPVAGYAETSAECPLCSNTRLATHQNQVAVAAPRPARTLPSPGLQPGHVSMPAQWQ